MANNERTSKTQSKREAGAAQAPKKGYDARHKALIYMRSSGVQKVELGLWNAPLKWSTNWGMIVPFSIGLNDG